VSLTSFSLSYFSPSTSPFPLVIHQFPLLHFNLSPLSSHPSSPYSSFERLSAYLGYHLADADNRNRLRNIEATEKAKREMLEARSAKPKTTERSKKPNESEESYAGARCTSFLSMPSLSLLYPPSSSRCDGNRDTVGRFERYRDSKRRGKS
jgi:hypothetical protein